jgi:two-component system OmpR family response regulator
MRPTGLLRVLSAGDEETSAILAALLSFSHIDVIAADTIAEAIELAGSSNFDVHILETRFPDGDGFELCRALKRSIPYVPNVFFTGDVLPEDRARGLSCGADAYLTKPYQGDMCSLVLELISEGRQRRAAYKNARPVSRHAHRRSAGII